MKRRILFALMLVLLSSQAAYGMSRIKRIKDGVCYWISEFLEFAEQEGVNDCQFYSQLYCEKELICAKVVRQAMDSCFMQKLFEGEEENFSLLAQILNKGFERFNIKGWENKQKIVRTALKQLVEERAFEVEKFCEEKNMKEQEKLEFFWLFFQTNVVSFFGDQK